MSIDEKLVQDYQRRKVLNLIIEVEIAMGGDAESAKSYAEDILNNCANDLQSTLTCFLELHALYCKPVEKKAYTRIKGHGAFYGQTDE